MFFPCLPIEQAMSAPTGNVPGTGNGPPLPRILEENTPQMEATPKQPDKQPTNEESHVEGSVSLTPRELGQGSRPPNEDYYNPERYVPMVELDNRRLRESLAKAMRQNEEMMRRAIEAQTPLRRARGHPRDSIVTRVAKQNQIPGTRASARINHSEVPSRNPSRTNQPREVPVPTRNNQVLPQEARNHNPEPPRSTVNNERQPPSPIRHPPIGKKIRVHNEMGVPDVPQPPPPRATGVTINEPTGAPRPAAAPVPLGKGKKKATEPILESLDEKGTDFTLLDSLPILCHLFNGDDMDSENVLDMYCALEIPEPSASKKKASRWHQGESSKAPSAKKSCTADPPANVPSTNATPPTSPLERQSPPAPVGSTPSPLAPAAQTQHAAPASTGGNISSRALRSAKDRMATILKHERCPEAMAGTETMDVDHILTRALNKLAQCKLCFFCRD
ncbi:actin cytoskeleton-regulatory complex protein PAN1-like [Humulus lupulus]|uniref:actin cytoskeleton-regulatory complex protein PAN1-like n=1 Tax=Humulus lupulus TaxID=3486 RepID=UPI002B40ED34|nr:actin cytoskeleton-regulatory complex protein PAN1-like [Humulus lupulus]